MSTALAELRGQVEDRRRKLKTIMDESGPDYDLMKATGLDGADMKTRVEQVQSLDQELTDLVKQIEEHPETKLADTKRRLEMLDALNPHPGHQPQKNGDDGDGDGDGDGQKGRGGRQEVKSLGTRFAESEMVKGWPGRGRIAVSFDADDVTFKGGVKTTFATSGSNLAPLSIEDLPGIQLINQQPLRIADLLLEGTTTRETIRYVVENSFTNAATVVAEGATKPEAAWDTDIVTDPITKIAVLSRVTDELFADFPMLRDYIDTRMRFMLGQTEETELLSGDGTGVHLTGILNRSGIQTQAASSDPVPDAIFKAIVKIQWTGPFVDPDGAVLHPLDWQDIALMRTPDGIYIWGSPAQAAAQPRIWGLPVVVTSAMTQNTGLVGAFKQAQIWRRQGVTVDATNSNEDDFKKNLIMLRAEERLGLAVYRPNAFCTVTGI